MASLRPATWRWHTWLSAAVVLTVAVGLCVQVLRNRDASGDAAASSDSRSTEAGDGTDHAQAAFGPNAPVTFNRDVAPIVFPQCASCHHAGEAVPFHLVSYQDFKKRAKQIREVVTSRYMPPWMPVGSEPHFKDERILTKKQIATIQAWVDAGAPEGDPRDRPPPPKFEAGWVLGKPDVVVEMPEAYRVPAEGKDIYRNFVVPVGLPEGKWIKGVHVRTPGSTGVHHGFVFVDSTGRVAREKDAAEADVGYSGMDPGSGVDSPPGQYLSWQPGTQASMEGEEKSWWLARHSDLVLQMHIRPSGREEDLKAEVGLYFSDTPATIHPARLMLRSVGIDIPAGAKDYAIESSYVTPVDLEVLSVLPHAHYLGRKVKGWATLPDGQERLLLRIDDWNFDWQGNYRYAQPIKLPAGTRLSMRIEYDNSADNARNPNHPPRRVTYGLNSSDEMGEFHMQVVTSDAREMEKLTADYREKYAIPDSIATARALLKIEPKSPERLVKLGAVLLAADEVDQAIELFQQALAVDPRYATAHYQMGHAYAMKQEPRRAVDEWQKVLEIDPRHFRAHNNLGYWYLMQRELDKAEEHLLAAVGENENDLLSRINLARLYAAKGEWTSVEAELREALKIDPQNQAVRKSWQDARERLRIR